jgi:hypoxanthine phosphoribosyltransferase
MIKIFMAEKLIITFDQYTKIVEKLAVEIHNGYKPTVLVGIMRGAAPILDILSRVLKLPIAYIVIQSYSGDGMEDKQGQLMFAREISSLAENKDFDKVLLVDDLSDTGLTLNKSIEWLKKYEPTKNYINEVKTACLWKKKSSTFQPDFCPVKLDSDPWIVQPTEHYEELSIEEIIEINRAGISPSPKNNFSKQLQN